MSDLTGNSALLDQRLLIIRAFVSAEWTSWPTR